MVDVVHSIALPDARAYVFDAYRVHRAGGQGLVLILGHHGPQKTPVPVVCENVVSHLIPTFRAVVDLVERGGPFSLLVRLENSEIDALNRTLYERYNAEGRDRRIQY